MSSFVPRSRDYGATLLFRKVEIKAGEGNRTLVCSLGSCHSTIELHPRFEEVNSDE
jgi:hypothetical protein